MSPETVRAYLRVAREEGAEALEVELPGGGALRARLGSGLGLVPRQPPPGETADRLADVDESILFGSAGGES